MVVTNPQTTTSTGGVGPPAEASDDPVLRHVVLFGFSATTSESDVAEVVRRFTALRDLVPGIEGFEWGPNNSPENLNNALTHCFVLTFLSTEARDAYLRAPEHVAFADWVGTWVQHVTVVDYWTTVTNSATHH